MSAGRCRVVCIIIGPAAVDAAFIANSVPAAVAGGFWWHIFSNVNRPPQVAAAGVCGNSAAGIAAHTAVGQPSKRGSAAAGKGIPIVMAVKVAAGGAQSAVQAAATADKTVAH